jgi:hypothetical protein
VPHQKSKLAHCDSAMDKGINCKHLTVRLHSPREFAMFAFLKRMGTITRLSQSLGGQRQSPHSHEPGMHSILPVENSPEVASEYTTSAKRESSAGHFDRSLLVDLTAHSSPPLRPSCSVGPAAIRVASRPGRACSHRGPPIS